MTYSLVDWFTTTNMAELQASSNVTCSIGIKTAIREVIAEIDSITAIKKEQEYALSEFLSGKDVLAVLPTGFGKSLIYQLAPLVTKKMFPDCNPIYIVVSPLVALMEDQVKEATKLGVTAVQLGVQNITDIEEGSYHSIWQSRGLADE